MIISKEYNDDLISIVTTIKNNIYNSLLNVDVSFTSISFLVPVTEDFIKKYKINNDFEFIVKLTDWNEAEINVNYKGCEIKPEGYYIRPDNYVEAHLLDVFQECIKQNTNRPDITKLELPDIKRTRRHKLERIK